MNSGAGSGLSSTNLGRVKAMTKTRTERNREVAGLAPISHLAAVVLDSLDELLDGDTGVTEMDRVSKFQLRLLASFFDSARRGSLDDLSELVEAHAQSVTASSVDDNRPRTRPPSLDDDYGSWKVLKDLAGDHAGELAQKGGKFVDELLDGEESGLEDPFAKQMLLPFLDKLAHADEKTAMERVEGWHSLHS
jgi:hypothetical protein